MIFTDKKMSSRTARSADPGPTVQTGLNSPWPGLTRPPSTPASAGVKEFTVSQTFACWLAALSPAMERQP